MSWYTMTDREEHDYEAARGMFEEDEEEQKEVLAEDALEWLIYLAEGYVDEAVVEFLQDVAAALSEKVRVRAVAADFCDKHESEIRNYRVL